MGNAQQSYKACAAHGSDSAAFLETGDKKSFISNEPEKPHKNCDFCQPGLVWLCSANHHCICVDCNAQQNYKACAAHSCGSAAFLETGDKKNFISNEPEKPHNNCDFCQPGLVWLCRVNHHFICVDCNAQQN